MRLNNSLCLLLLSILTGWRFTWKPHYPTQKHSFLKEYEQVKEASTPFWLIMCTKKEGLIKTTFIGPLPCVGSYYHVPPSFGVNSSQDISTHLTTLLMLNRGLMCPYMFVRPTATPPYSPHTQTNAAWLSLHVHGKTSPYTLVPKLTGSANCALSCIGTFSGSLLCSGLFDDVAELVKRDSPV